MFLVGLRVNRCLHWDLTYTIKFTQPPLLCPLFHDPLPLRCGHHIWMLPYRNGECNEFGRWRGGGPLASSWTFLHTWFLTTFSFTSFRLNSRFISAFRNLTSANIFLTGSSPFAVRRCCLCCAHLNDTDFNLTIFFSKYGEFCSFGFFL